ncbi:MAG: hypothetical protein ACI4KA_07685 [Oscillospiraceae bacterium]
MSKKQKESLAPIISTIVVAVLAIGMAFAAILLLKSDKKPQGTVSSNPTSSFDTTEEFNTECEIAIPKLVEGNSNVIRLFITHGLNHESEPYGNEPSDGLYTVSDREYTTLKQIEDYVRSIYTEEEANRILNNIDGKGLAVYRDRKIKVRVEETAEGTAESTAESSGIQYRDEYVLGISSAFVPNTDYSRDWTDLNYSYEPVTETECRITLYFNGYIPGENAPEPGADDVLNLTMVKVGGEWKLTALKY